LSELRHRGAVPPRNVAEGLTPPDRVAPGARHLHDRCPGDAALRPHPLEIRRERLPMTRRYANRERPSRGCHAADEVGVEVPDLLMLHPRRLRHLLEARPPGHPHHLVAQRLLVAQLPKTVLLRLLRNVPRRQHERHVVPRLLRQIPRNLPVELVIPPPAPRTLP